MKNFYENNYFVLTNFPENSFLSGTDASGNLWYTNEIKSAWKFIDIMEAQLTRAKYKDRLKTTFLIEVAERIYKA